MELPSFLTTALSEHVSAGNRAGVLRAPPKAGSCGGTLETSIKNYSTTGFISCRKLVQEHSYGKLSVASVLGQMTSAWPRKVLFSPCCCYFIPSSNQALGAGTCLWRLRLSISERTQPTLPSPPQTRIRKVSNFWNKRKLQRRERKKQEGKNNQLLQKEIIIPI